MDEPSMRLLCSDLEAVVADLDADPGSAGAWERARAALAFFRVREEDDEELALAIELEDAESLKAIVEGWVSEKRLMLVRDRDVLKRAMKAYRKRLKITLLDAESSVGGGPMSSGRRSDIVGVAPPDRYPRTVWDHLVRQERLNHCGHGTYELGPKA